MAEQTQKDFDAIRKDLETLRADMDALTKSQADDRVERARAGLHEAGESVRRNARQLRESVGGQVEERPLTALLSAFGIGMVLGTLVGRKG